MSAQEVITAAEVKQAEQERRSLLATFADRYGMEANKMLATLRATVLRPSNNGADPSVEQVASFLIVANHHSLNPFTKEIHGFVDKRGGIVPIVGLDGWAKKINEHPQFDGMTFEQDDEKCTCTMYRKDRKYPTVHTEWLAECKQPTQPWTTHPKRMLNWKALIQTARIAFGFAGIYEPDEAERVVEAINAEIDAPTETNFGPAKIGAVRMRQICEDAIKAANANDPKAMWAVWGELTKAEVELVWRQLRSYERSAIKKVLGSDAYKAVGVVPWSLELIAACKDGPALETAWKTIQDAFAEADAEVPLDINTVYQDRRTELGV